MFEKNISNPYIMVFPFILVMKRELTLSFLCVQF